MCYLHHLRQKRRFLLLKQNILLYTNTKFALCGCVTRGVSLLTPIFGVKGWKPRYSQKRPNQSNYAMGVAVQVHIHAVRVLL